jgi:hypothetical protein
VAPGCVRRKYPKEEGLTFFKTNAREFMEIDPWSAFRRQAQPGATGILAVAWSLLSTTLGGYCFKPQRGRG